MRTYLLASLRVMHARISCLALLLAVATAYPAEAAKPDAGFHLYLLIGQSNMAGRGKVDAESAKSDPRVLMLNKQLLWVPAVDPLHFDKAAAGVGPGLAFGKRMAAALPKVRIGLIPCAVGGTSIKVWAPGAVDPGTKTHPYDDMLARARTALGAGVLKGIIWHQGEANRAEAQTYGASLTELVARLRQDLAAPQVSFVAGELPSFAPENAEITKAFNLALHAIKPPIPHFAVVSAAGLGHKGDKLHFDSASARLLGGLYAEAMLALQQAR